MRDLVILLVHLITTILRLVRPGGVHAIMAESVVTKHQLLILHRSRQRRGNLAERSAGNGHIRICEKRVIEQVEEVSAELRIHLFRHHRN